jgi:hypothetical protein
VCSILGRRIAGREEALEEAEAMCSERIVVLKAMHALEYLLASGIEVWDETRHVLKQRRRSR